MARQANQEAINRIQAARSKSLKLMQLEANGTLDKIAKAHEGVINETFNEGNTMLTENIMTTNVDRKQAPIQTQHLSVAANNVPSAIREAFMNNPIDDSSLYKALGDGRDLSFLTNDIVEQTITQPSQNVRQIVNEGIGQATQYVQPSLQQVDYPMIRTIVEEIVRKYAVSLNKKIINEGKDGNEINTISLGKTFKFLDSKGNIYEAKLVKVGNINDKKKSVNG